MVSIRLSVRTVNGTSLNVMKDWLSWFEQSTTQFTLDDNDSQYLTADFSVIEENGISFRNSNYYAFDELKTVIQNAHRSRLPVDVSIRSEDTNFCFERFASNIGCSEKNIVLDNKRRHKERLL